MLFIFVLRKPPATSRSSRLSPSVLRLMPFLVLEVWTTL